IRASADDQEASSIAGVNTRHVFGIAAAIAFATVALAGLALGSSSSFDPSAGPARLIFAFEAVIIGGVGSLWGTLVGGMILGGAAVVVILLATLPYVVYADVTDLLVNAFILLVLASMWNLLAGYCGLISVGQQAYIGVGAYTVLVMAQNGINPYLAIPLAIAVAAAIAVPVSFLVFRLRAEYFAIGTWVVAEVFFLVLIRFRSLRGGTG